MGPLLCALQLAQSDQDRNGSTTANSCMRSKGLSLVCCTLH